jgi:DNA-binding transcriptional regulator YhcF (GntR family)
VDIRLDRSSEVPVGVQLAWHLRARMADGELGPGAKLPSVRELAASTGVNANTVRAVYARLEAEGMLATQHGRGTFVTASAPAGDELSAIAARAAREAAAAGVDPRAVAAALYVGGGSDEEAARRRALRAEIARLERRLAGDQRAQQLLAAHAEDPLASPPRREAGRLLSTAELEAQRDELAERIALLADAPATPPARQEAGDAVQHSTARNARVTLAPAAPQWRFGHGG